jgi:hypothetical protein
MQHFWVKPAHGFVGRLCAGEAAKFGIQDGMRSTDPGKKPVPGLWNKGQLVPKQLPAFLHQDLRLTPTRLAHTSLAVCFSDS